MGEVPVPAYAALQDNAATTQRMMGALLRGVSTRQYEVNSARRFNLQLRLGHAPHERSPPAFLPYQNRIKNPSERAFGVVRRAKSRFPRLLERLKKRETE